MPIKFEQAAAFGDAFRRRYTPTDQDKAEAENYQRELENAQKANNLRSRGLDINEKRLDYLEQKQQENYEVLKQQQQERAEATPAYNSIVDFSLQGNLKGGLDSLNKFFKLPSNVQLVEDYLDFTPDSVRVLNPDNPFDKKFLETAYKKKYNAGLNDVDSEDEKASATKGDNPNAKKTIAEKKKQRDDWVNDMVNSRGFVVKDTNGNDHFMSMETLQQAFKRGNLISAEKQRQLELQGMFIQDRAMYVSGLKDSPPNLKDYFPDSKSSSGNKEDHNFRSYQQAATKAFMEGNLELGEFFRKLNLEQKNRDGDGSGGNGKDYKLNDIESAIATGLYNGTITQEQFNSLMSAHRAINPPSKDQIEAQYLQQDSDYGETRDQTRAKRANKAYSDYEFYIGKAKESQDSGDTNSVNDYIRLASESLAEHWKYLSDDEKKDFEEKLSALTAPIEKAKGADGMKIDIDDYKNQQDNVDKMVARFDSMPLDVQHNISMKVHALRSGNSGESRALNESSLALGYMDDMYSVLVELGLQDKIKFDGDGGLEVYAKDYWGSDEGLSNAKLMASKAEIFISQISRLPGGANDNNTATRDLIARANAFIALVRTDPASAMVAFGSFIKEAKTKAMIIPDYQIVALGRGHELKQSYKLLDLFFPSKNSDINSAKYDDESKKESEGT